MALLTAKFIAIFLGLAATAFCVATIVLAVQKADLENELQDALDRLDALDTSTTNIQTSSTSTTSTTTSTSTTTTTSPGTPSPGTPTPETPTPETPTTPSTPSTPPGTTTTTENPTNGTTTTTPFPWPTITVPQPTQDPGYPTLPPGLPNPDEIIYRLPNHIRPIKYRLYLEPNMTTKVFDGTVNVQIEIDIQTNLIIMHAKNLTIESITIQNMMTRMRILIRESYLSEERELLIIVLEELLYTATPYNVAISYSGIMSGLSGMYASSYLDPNGKET